MSKGEIVEEQLPVLDNWKKRYLQAENYGGILGPAIFKGFQGDSGGRLTIRAQETSERPDAEELAKYLDLADSDNGGRLLGLISKSGQAYPRTWRVTAGVRRTKNEGPLLRLKVWVSKDVEAFRWVTSLGLFEEIHFRVWDMIEVERMREDVQHLAVRLAELRGVSSAEILVPATAKVARVARTHVGSEGNRYIHRIPILHLPDVRWLLAQKLEQERAAKRPTTA